MSANRTAFTCRRPSPNLQHRPNPFMRLVFQFPYELTEGKVRDLFSKKCFHASKIQVFKEQDVKTSAQVYSKFPMVICSLIGSLLVDTCHLFSAPFFVIRAFHLSGMLSLCFCQLLGVVFVEHWRRIRLTVRASQEVFDSKVEPFSLTRLGFIFDFTIVFSERDVHVSEGVSCNLNLYDFTLYFSVECEPIPTSVETNTIRWVVSFVLLCV